MTDLVTNAYGNTDVFGKGNLSKILEKAADNYGSKTFYKTYCNIRDADWVKLFGTNVIYNDTNDTFKPIGSLLNQTTIKNDNVDLITAEVVLKVMEKLENAIRTVNTSHNMYQKLMSEHINNNDGIGYIMYHVLNFNTYRVPQVNLFNEYILNKILATRMKRRYVIIEGSASYIAFSEIRIFNHTRGYYDISVDQVDQVDQVTTSSVHNYGIGNQDRHNLVDNIGPGTIHECWHSKGPETKLPSLVPYSNQKTHHVIIDLGEPKDIGEIEIWSRNQSGGAGIVSDYHTVYLTDHLYWRQTSNPTHIHSSWAYGVSGFRDPNAKWITDPYNPVSGQGSEGNRYNASAATRTVDDQWVDHPTPQIGGQSVFTYVFDGNRIEGFNKLSSYEFLINTIMDDTLHVYLNGERVTQDYIHGYAHGSWDIPSSLIVQGKPGINRFDFVLQNGGGPAGLLATVDYKSIEPTLKQYQYVYVQLDNPSEVGKWSEIQVFDENNAPITPTGGMVAPYDGTSSLHHDGNFLTFSDTNDPGDYPTFEDIITQIGSPIDGNDSFGRFGYSVSVSNPQADGSIIVAIGAPYTTERVQDGYERRFNLIKGLTYVPRYVEAERVGTTKVYKYTDGKWEIIKQLYGKYKNSMFGNSVSLSNDGRTLAIGSPGNDGYRGHTQIYKYIFLISGQWKEIGPPIVGEGTYDISGHNVSLSGDGYTVAIGARNNDGNGSKSGHTRVFRQFDYGDNSHGLDSQWNQVGSDINGQTISDFSGCSVSISNDGRTLAIGSRGNDNKGNNSGITRIYSYSFENSDWNETKAITGKGEYDRSGASVSLSGDGKTVAIGSPFGIGPYRTDRIGHTRVFQKNSNSNNWTQLGTDITGKLHGDFFGSSVSISGDGKTLAIGGKLNDDNGHNSGHTAIYKYENANWNRIKVIEGDRSKDQSGYSVSLSEDGTTFAIGSPCNDGIDNTRPNSGITQVYTKTQTPVPVHKRFLESSKFMRSSTQGAWAMVDLGENHTISKVELHGAPNSISPISSHKVYLKGSDSTFSEIIQINSTSSTASVLQEDAQEDAHEHAVASYDITSIIQNNTFDSIDYSTTSLNSYRYVVVQIETPGSGNWPELQAFDAEGNLLQPDSENKSSFYSDDTTTIHGFTGGPWMMIDLGVAKKIATVRLLARQGEWGNQDAAYRTHPHRVYLSSTFNNNDVDSTNTIVMKSRDGLGFPMTDKSLPESQRQAIYKYDVVTATSDWKHAFSTGDNEWTMSEPYRSMLGSDTIQLPSMSAEHINVENNSDTRVTSYKFPTSPTDPIIDMGSSPVSFTVEFLTKYRYVIVQIDTVESANWAEIQAYDKDDTLISPIDSKLSSYHQSYPSSLHHDGDHGTFSHTNKKSATLNGVSRGDWALIDLGDLYEISNIVVVSRENFSSSSKRTSPHRVFLTDTFIDDEIGNNTLELVHTQASREDVGNQSTYTYSITGTQVSQQSWEISQDTDNQIVAYDDYFEYDDNIQRPTKTYQLAPEHLGYTGAYTLTMRDEGGNGWIGHTNMKVTSTNVHNMHTIRAVTQGPHESNAVPTNGTHHVLRMHLAGDTTPIRGKEPGAVQFNVSLQEVYQNKLLHIKRIMQDKTGKYRDENQYIKTQYDFINSNLSRFWNATTKKGTNAPSSIGEVIDISRADANRVLKHDILNNLYNTMFNDDVDLSLYELQQVSTKEPQPKYIYVGRKNTEMIDLTSSLKIKIPNGAIIKNYPNPTPVDSSGNIFGDNLKFEVTVSNDNILTIKRTDNFLQGWNNDVYFEYTMNDTPGSAYSSFTDNRILFTSRLGDLGKLSLEKLSYYIDNPNMVRNNISISQYANEIGVEMLQNSSLPRYNHGGYSDDARISNLPLSCGYAITTDTKDPTNVLNVRMYASIIISDPFDNDRKFAISSGVNLFDFVNIRKFNKGVSSSNFITYLTETIQTLNSDPLANFTENEYSTWEYGMRSEYDRLKCISSPSTPYWNGTLIKDCHLKGSTEDIPKRIFYILDYINTNYADLYNNQFMIINDIDGVGKVASIVKITIHEGKTTFQFRDSRIDNLFPIKSVNADMEVNGELQVANYKGDVLMHIDPVTDKTMLMGKMGINQEMHDITAMLDIDNLSNRNLLDFTKRFIPLVLDSVTKMDTFITYNPYDDTSLPLVQGKYQPITTTKVDKTAAIMELKMYTSKLPIREMTREKRFGTIQARVELPVRIYTVTAAYRVAHSLDDDKTKLLNYIDRLKAAKSKQEEVEEEARVWGAILEGAFTIATSFIPYGGDLLVGVIMQAANFDISEFIEGSVSGSSEEIQEKIEATQTLYNLKTAARNAQQTVINRLMDDMQTQAGLLGLSALYDRLLLWQTRLTIGIRMFTSRVMYINASINDWIRSVCAGSVYTVNTPSFSSFISGNAISGSEIRYKGAAWAYTMELSIVDGLSNAITEHTTRFLDANEQAIKNTGDSAWNTISYGLKDRVISLLSINSESMIDTTREVTNFFSGETITKRLPGYITTFKRRNQSGLATIMVHGHMSEKLSQLSSDEQIVLPFLSEYIRDAQNQVDKVKQEIMSNETTDIVESTKVQFDPEDTSASSIALLYEILDAKRLELSNAKRRLNALKWVISAFPSGAHGSAGDHRKILSWGYMSGWRSSTPHGWIFNDRRIYDGGDYKLNQYADIVRPKAEHELAIVTKTVKGLTDEINNLDEKQTTVMDNLQEYTSSHDWTDETHNRLKHIISDIYKMYLVHGETMKDSKLSYTCVLPVTTSADNMTSAMYIKIVLALENDSQPQLSLSGRMLDVTEYTRDLSYKETLMQLMQGFSAGSQLINYGSVLLVKYIDRFTNNIAITDPSDEILLSDIIRGDGLFINRFGSKNLYLVVDNISDSTILQHERYNHWNNKLVSDIFYPGTNTRVSTSYKNMNDTFITHYGFDPTTIDITNPLLANMYMIPHKYGDIWKIVMMRYIVIGFTRYRVSCVIEVEDYIDQSIITKGDSTFHGDFTVRSSDNREIFQIDTLNNTTANLFPLSIGGQQPRTMLDVQDASIMDINYFIQKVSKGMRELTAEYIATTSILSNTDDYKYKYRFNLDTKKAEDTIVIFHELYPEWGGQTYDDIMVADKDRASIIRDSILPALQRVIDTTLFYLGSIYSTRIEFTSGMKYSVHKTVKVNVPTPDATEDVVNNYNYVEVIGQGWDIQTYGINVITNPNVEKLMENLDATIEYINFIRDRTNNLGEGGVFDTPPNIRAILDKYRSIEQDVFKYQLRTVQSVLEQRVSSAEVSDTYDITINSSPAVIADIPDKEQRIYHTSFIVDYTKEYDGVDNRLIEGDFGIIPCRDSNYYYYAMFYKLRERMVDTTSEVVSSFNGTQTTTKTVTTIISDSHTTVTKNIVVSVTKRTITTDITQSSDTIENATETVTTEPNANGGTKTVTVTKTPTTSGGTETKTKTESVTIVSTDTTTTTHNIGDVTPSASSVRDSSIAVFFVNMTKDYILPSMSVEGDLAVAGELTLSGLTTRENAASVYLTVDPENHFVGINSNDRFANYSLKHTSEALGSIYDTSQHFYVKNDRYPNATFARIAENTDPITTDREYDATKDYTLFGTHSAATMLRNSEIWTYKEAMERADHYTTSLAAINTTDWQKKKRYGTDIAFEVKDVSGVTTELGQVQMVIDSIDIAGTLHAGFGVQVVDRTLGTIFPQALKNIMYVNNKSQLFVEGVMLGGKLFKSDGVDLFWGDKKVNFDTTNSTSTNSTDTSNNTDNSYTNVSNSTSSNNQSTDTSNNTDNSSTDIFGNTTNSSTNISSTSI